MGEDGGEESIISVHPRDERGKNKTILMVFMTREKLSEDGEEWERISDSQSKYQNGT